MKKVYEYKLFWFLVFVIITLLILLFISKSMFIPMMIYVAFPLVLGSGFWLLNVTSRDYYEDYEQQREFLKEVQEQYREVIDNVEWAALKVSDIESLSVSNELSLELQEISKIMSKINNTINSICKEIEDLKYKEGKEKKESINSIKRQLYENWKRIGELESIVYTM